MEKEYSDEDMSFKEYFKLFFIAVISGICVAIISDPYVLNLSFEKKGVFVLLSLVSCFFIVWLLIKFIEYMDY